VTLLEPRLGHLPLHFRAPADDNEGVDRVEFMFNGLRVMTAYDEPFECYFDPSFLQMTHQAYFGTNHEFTAAAYDSANNRMQAIFNYGELPTCMDTHLSIELTGGNYQTAEASVTSREINFRIHAKEKRCMEFRPRPRVPGEVPPPGNDAWGSVREVRVYFDDVLHDTLYPDDDQDEWYTCTLHTGTMNAPSDHVLRVDAVANDGCLRTESVFVSVRRVSAYLFVRRTIERRGNVLHVSTEISNTCSLAVHLDRFVEKVTGFQALITSRPGGTAQVSYDVENRQSALAFDWTYTLSPGDSLRFEYDAVPIMYEGIDDYAIGQDVELEYRDDYDRVYVRDFVGHVNTVVGPWGLDRAVEDAFAQSDYLIVTNPHNLTGIYDPGHVQELLTAMAELAIERNGVLGYFNGQGTIRSAFDRNDRIACGNVIDDARQELVVLDEEADLLRVYNATAERTIRVRVSDDRIETRLPISFADLTGSDALLVGNIRHLADGREPLDEIAVLKGGGPSRGELRVYRYDPAADDFTVYVGSISFDPGAGDQAIVADMIVTTPNTRQEIVVFRGATGRVEGYYGEGGLVQSRFDSVYSAGDLVAAGDLMPDAGDEIVIGDLSAGEVVIYNGHTGHLLARFPYALTSRDRLAVCEEGLVIADESADRVDILQIDPGGPTVIGGFTREMRAATFCFADE
jgi:hypothetical protein